MRPGKNGPDRREMLQQVALAGSLPLLTTPAQAAETPQPQAPAHPDFTRSSAALEPDRVVRSACQFCNSLCGLQVHLKAGRVIAVKGEDRDPVQAGELCVKAELMPQLVY